LFSEGGSRIVFSINPKKEKEWLNYLKKFGPEKLLESFV